MSLRSHTRGEDTMETTVEVNGEKIKLTDFPHKIITETVLAMLRTLRGVEEITSAVIRVEAR